MDDFILLSELNDFIFCPYSIYLHNVYMDSDEDLYHAVPQQRGRNAHAAVDTHAYSTRKGDITSMSVRSEEFGIMGKIDIYRGAEATLIERKYELRNIYRGQLYQLWGEALCMMEMGYEVRQIGFHEIVSNRFTPIALPSQADKEELRDLVRRFRDYSPNDPLQVSPNKCAHCIYCNICDKTSADNVYA